MNTIKVPEGVDWAAVTKNAMDKYNLEIAGGLGPTAGKVWRIGIMVGNVACSVDFRCGLLHLLTPLIAAVLKRQTCVGSP